MYSYVFKSDMVSGEHSKNQSHAVRKGDMSANSHLILYKEHRKEATAEKWDINMLAKDEQ